jgi:pyrroloquinoline quinone (PQQ) biosynthesis protein C
MRYETQEPITGHRFLQKLRQEPVRLQHLWVLLANFQISISKTFARHLASIIARVEDERVRSILAEQLNDELGRGKPERAHTQLFIAMMKQLEPWRPREAQDDSTLSAGRNLIPRLAEIYGASNIDEAVGALMAGEVFGKQMDQFIADEFRRQQEITPESLEWLALHEQLEVEHADSSLDLARLLPKEALDATWSGASRLARAGWAFLDDLHSTVYGAAA